jgi:ABC-type multidrug transport system ATPase subunit
MPPWNPSLGVNCLIGPGDSTKTTILDAIELCLYPRSYFLADDSDFFNLEFDNPIKIIVTLTDLPTEFIAVDRYGLFLRGWDEKTKKVEDEPRENFMYALSIALVIDKSLEGRWSVFNDRIKSSKDDPPHIRYKDVGQIATTRLGRYAERHLGWGRTSILARIAESGGKFSVQLAEARRAAKNAFEKSAQLAFQVTTKKAEDLAKSFSVPVQSGYRADLDIDASTISSGGIALHDGNLPLRRLGTGSSRLVVAALQHAAGSPNISLIDELENGLEPHRIARLLKHIQTPHEGLSVPPQVFLTTHSPTVIRELSVDDIYTVRSKAGETHVLSVSEKSNDNGSAQKHLRAEPEAFLARRVVVGEGRTEMGLVRGLDDWWSKRGMDSLALLGVVAIDGRGKDSAPQICATLLDLGYSVFLLHDTDEQPNPDLLNEVKEKGGVIESWSGKCSTEERIFLDVPWKTLCELIEFAEDCKGTNSVLANIQSAVKGDTSLTISSLNLSTWSDSPELRSALGRAAKGKNAENADWFKNITSGECLGNIIGPCLETVSSTPLAASLKRLRDWIDG